jgi:hypothetical protein
LKAIVALTKVVEKMHPSPDAFGGTGTYTCSIKKRQDEAEKACLSSLSSLIRWIRSATGQK